MNMEYKFLLLPRRSAGERNPVPPPKLLQMEDMPMWKTLPYDTKYPLQKVAKEDEKPLSKEIGKSLYDEYPNKDFDLRVAENPILPSISYNSLHDPHLQHFFQSTLRYRNLVKRGFVSKDGKVRFHLAQFNQYRMYLYHLWVMQVNQLRRNQVCEEKKRVKSVLEAHDSKDILCEKVLNKYDRIDIEAVLEELSARILQEYGFSPLARSLFRWKCYQDKLRKNYKESYPVMKQWLSAQTKNYTLLLESKLNARRNKDRKLRIRLEKLRESSKARLSRVTYLRQLQEDSRRILKEERHKYFAKIWAKNDRKMHLKKRKPVTKVDKKSTISEDTLLNYWKAKGFGLGQDADAQLQGCEIPFSSSVSESCEEIIKKSCDTSEGNTSLSHNTAKDESKNCFRKHPQVLDYSSVLNHRSEHVTPDECPSVKEVNRHPSDLVKGTISDFEAKDITVKKFQSHNLPSDKRPLKVLKKNNEDLRGTNKNNEDLRGTNRNNEDLRGTKKNNEDFRSKLLALSSSQSTTDTFEESLTEEEKNLLQTKASVSVRKRKLKSHERTSTDPTKSSSLCNRLFSSVSKLQGKQTKKTESEKNKKKLDEEDDLLITSRNDSKRYINRKFSFPECESSSSCATYGKQKPKQEAKLCNRRKEDTHSNSISRCDIQAENHISKLDQAKETKEEPCYDSTKQKQIKTKYSIESFQSEHTKLRQNNTNKRHEMEYWTKEIDLDSDKASSVEALGLRTDMQKDIHLGKLNQLKQTKEEPCNKLRFQKQAERKSGTKSLQSERKKIRRNSSLNQRKQQEIQCWKEESDKASEAEVRRFHSNRQKEINLAELDQSEETKEQPYDQLRKQKWAKSKYSPELFQSEQKKAKRNGTVNQIKQQVADYCGKKAGMESDKILEASTSRLRTDIHEESGKTLEARLRTDMHEDISSSKLDQWKQTKDDKCDNLKNKKQAKAKSSFEYLHSEQKKEGYSGTLNQMKQPERDYYVKETETESDEVLKMEVSGTSNDDYPIINHFSPQEKQKFCKITWKMLENSLLERRKKYSDLNGLDELKLKLKKNELIQKEFSNILKDYPSTTEIISRSVSCAKKGSKSETGNFIEKLGAFRSLTWKKPQTEEKQVLKKKDFSIERSFSNVRKNKEHHDVKITDEDYARIPSTNGGIIKTVERAGIKACTGTKFTKTLAEDFVHRNNEAEIKKKVLKRFKDNFFIEMYMAQKHRLQRDLHDYFFTDSISRSQVKRYYESGTKDREESVLPIDHYEIKEGKKIINQKQHKFEFDGRDSIHSESEHKIAPHKKRSNIISGITKTEIQKPIEKFELSKESEQLIKKKDAISRSRLEEEKLPSNTKVLELGKEDNGLLSTSILNEDYHVDLINPEIREESISDNEFYPTDNELLSKTTESEIPMPIEKSELSKGTEQIIKKEDVASRSCLEEENISSDAKVSELKKEDNGLLSTSILNEDYHVDLISPEISEESIFANELYPTDNEMLSEIIEAGIQKPNEKTELSQVIPQTSEKGGISKSRLEQAKVLSYSETRKCEKDEEGDTLFSNANYHADLISSEMSEECISAHKIYPTDNGSFSENLQKTEEDFTTFLKTCAADEQTTDFSADDTKYSSAPLKDETIFHFSNVQLSKDKHSEIPGSNVFISPYILHKNKVLSISSKEYPYSDENMYSDEGYGKRLERKMPSENALETETVSTVFELPLFPETEHWNYDSRIEDVSNQILAVQDRSNDNYEENRLTAQNSLDTSEFRIVSTVRTEFEMPKFPQAELTKNDSVTSMNEETACLCTPRIRKQEPEKNTVNLTTCKENRASKKTSPIPLTVNDVTVKTDYTLPKKESISYFKDSGSDKFVCEKLPSANLNRELDQLKFVSPVPEPTKHTFTTRREDNNTIRNPEFTTEQTPVADLTKRNEPYSLPNKIPTVIESCKIPENSAVKQINVELARGTSISSNVSSTTVNSFAPSPSTEATVTAMRMPTQTVSKFSAPTNDYAIQLFEETLLEPKWKQAQYICQVHSGASFSSSTLQRETNIDVPANMIIPVNANETKTLQFRINESKPSIISDLNQLMEAYFSEYHRIRQYYTVEDALMLWKQRRSLEDIMKTSFFNIQNREWILHKAVEFINMKYTVMKTQDLDPDIIDLINLIALNFSLPHSRPIVKSISINEGFQNNTENKKNFLHDIESKDIFIKSGIETLDPISSPSQLSNETALNKIIFTEINEQRFSTSNTLEISFGTYSSPVCVFYETELESVPIHEFVSLEKTKLQYMLQFPKSVIHPQSVRIEEIYESCESDLNQEFTSRYSTEQPTDNGENISSTDPSSILDFKSDHSYVKDYPYSHDFTSNESDNNVIDIKRKIEKSGSLNIALEYLPETKKSASDDNLKPFLKHRKKTPKPSAQIPIYSDEHQAADSERQQYQAQKMFETNEKDKILDISTQTYPMSSERNNLDWLVQLFFLLNSFKTSSSYSWRMNENLNLSELPFLQTFMRLQDEHPNLYTADPKTILSLDSHGILRREQQYERFQMDTPSQISDYDYTFSEKIPQEEACTSEAISTINVLQLKRPKILCHLKASGIESIKLSVSRKDIQYLESESKALSSTIGLPKLEADATSKDEVSNDAEGKEISKLPYSRARLSNATILSLIDDKIRSLEAYFSEHNNDSKSE